MTFTKDEEEFLLNVLDKAICESQDVIEGIETYLNYMRSDAVFKGKMRCTPEMRSYAIGRAQGHADVANSELHKLIGLKNKVLKETTIEVDYDNLSKSASDNCSSRQEERAQFHTT